MGKIQKGNEITGQILLDELWNTMEAELYQLAYDQGNIDTLTTEDLIMERIKDLSVVAQHAVVNGNPTQHDT